MRLGSNYFHLLYHLNDPDPAIDRNWLFHMHIVHSMIHGIFQDNDLITLSLKPGFDPLFQFSFDSPAAQEIIQLYHRNNFLMNKYTKNQMMLKSWGRSYFDYEYFKQLKQAEVIGEDFRKPSAEKMARSDKFRKSHRVFGNIRHMTGGRDLLRAKGNLGSDDSDNSESSNQRNWMRIISKRRGIRRQTEDSSDDNESVSSSSSSSSSETSSSSSSDNEPPYNVQQLMLDMGISPSNSQSQSGSTFLALPLEEQNVASESSSSSESEEDDASGSEEDRGYPHRVLDRNFGGIAAFPPSERRRRQEKLIQDMKDRDAKEILFDDEGINTYFLEDVDIATSNVEMNLYRYFSNKKIQNYKKFHGIPLIYLAAYFGYNSFLSFLLERYQTAIPMEVINRRYIAHQTIFSLCCRHACAQSANYLLANYPELELDLFIQKPHPESPEKRLRMEMRKMLWESGDDDSLQPYGSLRDPNKVVEKLREMGKEENGDGSDRGEEGNKDQPEGNGSDLDEDMKEMIEVTRRVLPLYHLCSHSLDDEALLFLDHPRFNRDLLQAGTEDRTKYCVAKLINLGAYYELPKMTLKLIREYGDLIDVREINEVKKPQFNALIAACDRVFRKARETCKISDDADIGSGSGILSVSGVLEKEKKRREKMEASGESDPMVQVIEALTEIPGINLNYKHQGKTPFMLCCKNGLEEMAMKFLEMGPEKEIQYDTESSNKSEYSPLYYACKMGMTNVANAILDKLEGGKYNLFSTFTDGTALVLCCKKRVEMPLIERLLAHPEMTAKYLNAYDMNRQTALMYACKGLNEKLAMRLLEFAEDGKGLDPCMVDGEKRDAFYYAMKSKMKRVVKWFIDKRMIPFSPGSDRIIQTLMDKKWFSIPVPSSVPGEPSWIWSEEKGENGGGDGYGKREDLKCNICFDYSYQVTQSEDGGEPAKIDSTYFVKCRACVAVYHNHCLHAYYKNNHMDRIGQSLKCCCCRNSPGGFHYM